jgi:hypothetical protein
MLTIRVVILDRVVNALPTRNPGLLSTPESLLNQPQPLKLGCYTVATIRNQRLLAILGIFSVTIATLQHSHITQSPFVSNPTVPHRATIHIGRVPIVDIDLRVNSQ